MVTARETKSRQSGEEKRMNRAGIIDWSSKNIRFFFLKRELIGHIIYNQYTIDMYRNKLGIDDNLSKNIIQLIHRKI